ncbi:MAG: hypothetical protein GX443_06615 [Deltaproteobacteria bacterium]|nr:hypothetical protein [Deltaproteobacteria bacterium]
MTRRLQITAGSIVVSALLNESPTAEALWNALPLQASARTWGDEIYFPVPVEMPLDETAREVVNMGDLGYWPTGRAFCIFFGPTPMSRGDEIRPAGPVNVIGRVLGDARDFKAVHDGDLVELDTEE